VGAIERDEWLRAAWRVMVATKVDPERLVFVDEMGANTLLCALYAWSPKGERAHARVARNRGKNTTLLASTWVSKGWGIAWRSRAPPPLRSLRAM
jgi:hypothetical protein